MTRQHPQGDLTAILSPERTDPNTRPAITAVSYLNTVPLIHGIQHAEILQADLLLSPPSQCVANYRAGLADIALVPVAAIPSLTDARVVGTYCIGAVGSVRTVVLMSDTPLNGIRTIYTDAHSMTSAQLVTVLCRELWKITPEFIPMADYSIVERRRPGEAFLLIGDKVFGYEGTMTHSWDLADAWRELTGLPFVFAAWIARQNVLDATVALLDRALAWGTARIPQAIERYGHADKPYALQYLTENIDYSFDEDKRRALNLFWDKCSSTQ